MKFGLILGGGGIVGIAWELGVLVGLSRAGAPDPLSASVVVGTSAGAIVGAMASGGRSFDELLEMQRQSGEDQVVRAIPAGREGVRPGETSVVPQPIMDLITSGGAGTKETAAAVGKLAMEAPATLSEELFVAYIQTVLGTEAWPTIDFRPTAVDCLSGETVLWRREDGVPLARAVASSCTVPGYFPTIEIKGRRYTDAPRTPFCEALVAEKNLDAILFVGPQTLLPEGGPTLPEIDALASRGVRSLQITGGMALQALGIDLMDPTGRARALEIGMEEGASFAAALTELLGGSGERRA